MAMQSDNAHVRAGRQSRIAIVDDDPAFAMSTAALLRNDGFAVALFQSAEDFLDGEKRNYSCAMVDWMLPGMSGASLCHHLAERQSLILMSGAKSEDEAFQAGLGEEVLFFEKPFDPERLLAELARLFEPYE